VWNGAATLGGRLVVTVRPGVIPPVNSTCEIVFASGGVNGRFAAHELPTIGGQPVFDVVYGTNTVTLVTRIEYRCRADLSGDLDVDAKDLGMLNECMVGPMVPCAEGCENRDLNGDGFVDQQDFGLFQRCFGGEGVIADPGCGG
jgi:hypothetical protein